MFEKACDKTPVLQDSPVVNTTTAAQADIIDQNDTDNLTASTRKNQKLRKDTEERAMEKISVNIDETKYYMLDQKQYFQKQYIQK